MTLDDQKQQFSYAYVRSIAAAAGFSASVPEVDDDSVDIVLMRRGGGAVFRSPRIEVQLKCADVTTLTVTDAAVHFSLKRKNYDELRGINLLVPRILIVLMVPQNLGAWVDWTDQALTIRHASYWMSLRGLPEIGDANAGSTTVHVPRANEFSVAQLQAMGNRIGAGALP